MVKILHTADVHLGRQFPSLRQRGKEYRKQLLQTFEHVLGLAIDEDVSLILIAGDLFDTNRVYGIVIDKVISGFGKLEERKARLDFEKLQLKNVYDSASKSSPQNLLKLQLIAMIINFTISPSDRFSRRNVSDQLTPSSQPFEAMA